MLQRIYTLWPLAWSTIDRHMYSFVKRLRNAEHVRRYSILPTGSGWDVREEQDSHVVRQVHYTDWHRVERARRAFTLEVSHLREQGWEAIAD